MHENVHFHAGRADHTGDHGAHEERPPGRLAQAINSQDGSSTRYAIFPEQELPRKRIAAKSTVTLISSPPEVQWVALRNINLLLQKRPDILANEMRVFFCKYNDPPYVKVEKLDIMVRLASERNVDTFLGELRE